MKVKEYKRVMPILNIKYSIIVYKDPESLQKRFKDVEFDVPVTEFNGGFFELSGRYYIVLHDDGKLTHGMIAHECKHFINAAFHYIKQKIDTDNDELECYFLTYLVDEVYSVFSPS